MPRKPDWLDVPRREDGRFVARKRERVPTSRVKTAIYLIAMPILTLFFLAELALLLNFGTLAVGMSMLVGVFLSFPIAFFDLRYRSWIYPVVYFIFVVGLAVIVGSS